MIIYENQIKAKGCDADDFRDSGMIIIFGDNAPPELADCCYSVSVNPIYGEIKAGQTLKIDNETFKITAVGYEAPVTLKGLGHCTFNFNGATEVELPGTIYLEEKALPEIKIGSVLQIIES